MNLFKMKYDVDRSRLKTQLESLPLDKYICPNTGRSLDGWVLTHVTDGYGMEINDKFKAIIGSEECRPRFYILRAGTTLPMHIDRGTLCSMNFVLEGSSPITFEDGEEYYDTALLNTQVMHGVIDPVDDRILFKLSVFDKTYEEVKASLQKFLGE